MDVVKTFYAVLIGCDNVMKDEARRGAVANNTSISEDLGQAMIGHCTVLGQGRACTGAGHSSVPAAATRHQ